VFSEMSRSLETFVIESALLTIGILSSPQLNRRSLSDSPLTDRRPCEKNERNVALLLACCWPPPIVDQTIDPGRLGEGHTFKRRIHLNNSMVGPGA
jgi:hypothetical protein